MKYERLSNVYIFYGPNTVCPIQVWLNGMESANFTITFYTYFMFCLQREIFVD